MGHAVLSPVLIVALVTVAMVTHSTSAARQIMDPTASNGIEVITDANIPLSDIMLQAGFNHGISCIRSGKPCIRNIESCSGRCRTIRGIEVITDAKIPLSDIMLQAGFNHRISCIRLANLASGISNICSGRCRTIRCIEVITDAKIPLSDIMLQAGHPFFETLHREHRML